MTESKSRGGLSRQARESVGVGASVGAGCHPCVTHHVNAGTEAGLGAEALLGAIAAAERVSADASARMAQHARRQLTALPGGAGAGGTVRDATLAALGAAIAANSMPDIERYVTEAAELGVSRGELAEAVHLAHEVQGNAARIHARLTAKLLDPPQPGTQTPPAAQESAAEEQAGGCEETCPCNDEEGTPGDGAVPAKASAPAAADEATPVTQACGDVDAGDDNPAPETADPQPPAAAAGWSVAAAGMAACAPPPAMLAACCGRAPA
jgi:AhpD family alkylhydroperoxidase